MEKQLQKIPIKPGKKTPKPGEKKTFQKSIPRANTKSSKHLPKNGTKSIIRYICKEKWRGSIIIKVAVFHS